MCVCLTSPTGGGLLGHVVTVLYKPMLVAVVALVRVVIVGHKPMLKASVAVLRVVTVVSDPLRTRRQLYFASHFGRQAGPSGPTLAAPGLRIVVCWSAWSRWDMSRPCIGLCCQRIPNILSHCQSLLSLVRVVTWEDQLLKVRCDIADVRD